MHLEYPYLSQKKKDLMLKMNLETKNVVIYIYRSFHSMSHIWLNNYTKVVKMFTNIKKKHYTSFLLLPNPNEINIIPLLN